jgi:hypothetical protein
MDRCRFHKTYKACNKPSSDCLTCWILWAENPNRRGRLNLDNFKQILIAIDAKIRDIYTTIDDIRGDDFI